MKRKKPTPPRAMGIKDFSKVALRLSENKKSVDYAVFRTGDVDAIVKNTMDKNLFEKTIKTIPDKIPDGRVINMTMMDIRRKFSNINRTMAAIESEYGQNSYIYQTMSEHLESNKFNVYSNMSNKDLQKMIQRAGGAERVANLMTTWNYKQVQAKVKADAFNYLKDAYKTADAKELDELMKNIQRELFGASESLDYYLDYYYALREERGQDSETESIIDEIRRKDGKPRGRLSEEQLNKTIDALRKNLTPSLADTLNASIRAKADFYKKERELKHIKAQERKLSKVRNNGIV